jgi:hypothetical protein
MSKIETLIIRIFESAVFMVMCYGYILLTKEIMAHFELVTYNQINTLRRNPEFSQFISQWDLMNAALFLCIFVALVISAFRSVRT